MKRKKHRVIVEMSTSHAITDKQAVQAMNLLLRRVDLEARPALGDTYAIKLVAKSFAKVLGALK